MSEYITKNEENIYESHESNESVGKTYRTPLSDLSQREIIQIFDNLNIEGRHIIIPVGFPKAGKSLFISSLMYYSQRFTEKKWTARYLTTYPFEKGNLSRDLMIKYFDEKKAYPATTKGTLDLIGLNIEPNGNKRTLKLAFVDLAGEDLEEIKTSNSGKFNPKIDGILKACTLGKPTFCLITPLKPEKGDQNEDTLLLDFINYIHVNMPDLYDVSKFIIIVTQWDKMNSREKMNVESYIKQYRPALHGAIKSKNAKIAYGEFSVGQIEDVLDEKNEPVVLIRRLNFQYPHNFWNNLYKLATGKSLEGNFFTKIFG